MPQYGCFLILLQIYLATVLVGHPQLHAAIRSIPACAGEPTSNSSTWASDTVYPRVCGGTGRTQSHSEQRYGLSPRVRGNLSNRTAVVVVAGSIPACAGEPSHLRWPHCLSWVYPRVCGGTGLAHNPASPCMGLSPRVRGNPRRVAVCPDCAGSIPACAGEP